MVHHASTNNIKPKRMQDVDCPSRATTNIPYHRPVRPREVPIASTPALRMKQTPSARVSSVPVPAGMSIYSQGVSLLPPRSMGTSGTERGCSWSFTPSLFKTTRLGLCRPLRLASRISTNGVFRTCHGKLVSTSIFGGVHIHQITCYFFPLGRAVPFSQTRKRGATVLLPLPRYTVFLGLH